MRRRQKSAARVIHQVQLQSGIRLAVTQGVELLQPGNGTFKHAFTTLGIDILLAVARQGRHHLHPLLRQKFPQGFLARFIQYGQIAAIDYINIERTCRCNQITKTRMQFRCATGQIQRLHAMGFQYAQHIVQGRIVHQFSALGAGVDMAVSTTEIAQIAQIDLQYRQRATGNGRKIGSRTEQ